MKEYKVLLDYLNERKAIHNLNAMEYEFFKGFFNKLKHSDRIQLLKTHATNNQDGTAWMYLGMCYLALGKDYAWDVIVSLNKAILHKFAGNLSEICEVIALCYWDIGDQGRAERWYSHSERVQKIMSSGYEDSIADNADQLRRAMCEVYFDDYSESRYNYGNDDMLHLDSIKRNRRINDYKSVYVHNAREITIKDVEPNNPTKLSIKQVIKYEGGPSPIALDLLEEISRFMINNDLGFTMRGYVREQQISQEEVEVECAYTTTKSIDEVPKSGKIKVSKFAGGEAATTWHYGNANSMFITLFSLQLWANAAKRQVRENYWTVFHGLVPEVELIAFLES